MACPPVPGRPRPCGAPYWARGHHWHRILDPLVARIGHPDVALIDGRRGRTAGLLTPWALLSTAKSAPGREDIIRPGRTLYAMVQLSATQTSAGRQLRPGSGTGQTAALAAPMGYGAPLPSKTWMVPSLSATARAPDRQGQPLGRGHLYRRRRCAASERLVAGRVRVLSSDRARRRLRPIIHIWLAMSLRNTWQIVHQRPAGRGVSYSRYMKMFRACCAPGSTMCCHISGWGATCSPPAATR